MATKKPLCNYGGVIQELSTTDDIDTGAIPIGTLNQGDVLYDNGTAWTRLTPGTDGKVLTTHGASANPTWVQAGTGGGATTKPNLIINGSMNTWQRGTSFTSTTTPANSDDTYLMDRWILLSDGNDIADVIRSTDAPEGFKHSARFQVETANKRFGFIQIIEGVDAKQIIDKTASISFYTKKSADGPSNVRAALLSWNGAEDVVTSDVVDDWGGDVNGNPTLVANWTAENVATDISTSVSWVRNTISSIDIDASNTTNVALFIWVDDEDAAVDDELYITGVQINEGGIADYIHIHMQQEIANCQRYYQRIGEGSAYQRLGTGFTATPTLAYADIYFPVKMRTTPSIYPYGTAGYSSFGIWPTGHALSALVFNEGNTDCITLAATSSGMTANRIATLITYGDTAAYIGIEAEL